MKENIAMILHFSTKMSQMPYRSSFALNILGPVSYKSGV